MRVLLGEMFPNRIRAGALAVAAAAQWVANFFTFTTFPTFSSISLTFAYGFYAACALLSLVFVFFRAPEDQGQGVGGDGGPVGLTRRPSPKLSNIQSDSQNCC